MDNLRITSRGVKREASGLLTNNWCRALAILSVSAFAMMLFVQINQLVTTLMREFEQIRDAQGNLITLNSVNDYYAYYTAGGMRYDLLITLALVAFFFLLISPLNMGVTYWYRKLALCDALQVGQIFHYYRSNELFISAVIFSACRTALRLGFALVSFAPGVICFGLSVNAWMNTPEDTLLYTMLFIGGCALTIAGVLLYAVLSLRYFIAGYLFAGEYGYSPIECLRYSRIHMRGCTGSVLGVVLSFAGWFFSCVLIIPLVYVVPYFNASMAACAQDIIDDKMGETLDRLKRR